MVFPVVMYGCESWTVKKAEQRSIDAFELWCWRRLLRVPWMAGRSSQSILKEISPGCSLEGLMLMLKLQYLGTSREELTHWKRPWCWERLGAEEGDDRGWDGITDSIDVSLDGFQELIVDREAWFAVIHGVTKSWTRLSDWTELNESCYRTCSGTVVNWLDCKPSDNKYSFWLFVSIPQYISKSGTW